MAHFDDEKIALCALNLAFGFKPHISHALIEALGSAKAVFELDEEGLERIFGPYSESRKKINGNLLREAEKELEKAANIGCRFICHYEPAYPRLLAECEDFPVGIYVRSSRPAEDFANAADKISFVGTRDLSAYGRDWCRKLVEAVADAEHGPGGSPVIVSGFAFGTDYTAHKAAIDNGLFTIAVLPSGLDAVYPRHHYDFARSILRDDVGAFISDYPFNTAVNRIHFMRRNRIIAGLSRATVLIESKIRGGGLITCKQAFSYDREVYALPGRVDDSRSGGCNLLIRSGLATPIISGDNFVESLGYKTLNGSKAPEDIAKAYAGKLSERQIGTMEKIFDAVKSMGTISLDKLSDMAGAAFGEVSALTGILESDGYLAINVGGICSAIEKN